MAVISCRMRKDDTCEIGALRRPLVYGCRNLGRRLSTRSIRALEVDWNRGRGRASWGEEEIREGEMNRRNGFRRSWWEGITLGLY